MNLRQGPQNGECATETVVVRGMNSVPEHSESPIFIDGTVVRLPPFPKNEFNLGLTGRFTLPTPTLFKLIKKNIESNWHYSET